MEPWRARLEAGDTEAAWTLFLARYHRLIGATIARCTPSAEDARDAFAEICDRLSADDLARLRRFHAAPAHGAKFSTWLVVVVRNLAIDCRRAREGRPRSTPPPGLSSLRERIYQLVLVEHRSHVEAYETLRSRGECELSYRDFTREVASTFRSVDARRWSHLALLHGDADTPVEEIATHTGDLEHADQASRLAKALATLTPEERAAIQLFVVEDRSAAEVARAVGWTGPKTVYNRVHRALAALRAMMRAEPPRGESKT
ncbi:MAG TPA: sigma-70 family RNA polymerase sigma factor [Gemmatimonadaceae bacterium]|nr:sigma-70 family RNA polymerase sigma factor [Gemmatimonadaceae bacterium]